MKNKKVILKEKYQVNLIINNIIILILILLFNKILSIKLLNILNIFYYINIIILLKFGSLKKILKEVVK